MTWYDEMLDRLGRDFKPGDTFNIEDVYAHEAAMKEMYPNNRHVRETQRDLLQRYRDDGLIRMGYDGNYQALKDLRRHKRHDGGGAASAGGGS